MQFLSRCVFVRYVRFSYMKHLFLAGAKLRYISDVIIIVIIIVIVNTCQLF